MTKLFTPKTKLVDAVASHPNLILLLSRFNIPLGFGDGSISDICARHSVPVDFFLLISNIYSFDYYVPSKDEIINTDMSMLVAYLKKSHSYYIGNRIPHIERHLAVISEQIGGKIGAILSKFFAEYKSEVAEHFRYEEVNVFPHIERLINKESDKYEITTFAHSHSNIEDKLEDLTQIVFKYLPETVGQEDPISMIFDIVQLSHDLNKHNMIEDLVLVPYVEYLEKEIRKCVTE